jgi:putative DNA primase/helicase
LARGFEPATLKDESSMLSPRSASSSAALAESDPEYAERLLAAIPPELAATPRWICWRIAWDAERGKPTKLPVKPGRAEALAREHPAGTTLDAVEFKGRGILASTDRPDGWCSMHEALDAHALGGTSGLGFVFLASEDGILGLDLDDVRDPASGEFLPAAVRILEALPAAYAEVSPSLTGVKLWLRASIPGISSRPKAERDAAGEKAGLKVAIGADRLAATGELPVAELFSSKYFTATAWAIEGRSPDLSIDETTQLVAVLDELAPQWRGRLDPRWHEALPPAPTAQPLLHEAVVPGGGASGSGRGIRFVEDPPELDPEALPPEVRTLREGLDGTRRGWLDELWAGGKLATQPSHSEADYMLARMLVEGGISDPDRLGEILRESPRGRKRAKLRRADYLASTIRKATAGSSAPSAGGSDRRERGGAPAIWCVAGEGGEELGLTDHAVAAGFIDAAGASVRWDASRERWMRLEAGIWRPDETAATRGEIRQYLAKLSELVEAQHAEAGERAVAVARHQLGRAQRVRDAEWLARSDQRVAVTAEAWDRDPMLAGTPEGVLDLATGELRPLTGAEHLTRRLGVAPAPPGTACPRWERFLGEAMQGDDEVVAYLRRWCGYCLTGSTREHALLFGHGSGGNGKSVFIAVLGHVLGDYAATASMETLSERVGSEHSCELAALAGARLVVASEVREGSTWNEPRLKSLTGGDSITARFMRCNPFTYRPAFKLVVAGNHRPRIRNAGPAMARRLHMVPWLHTPPRPDRTLEERLKAEAPAILRWAIEGCIEWQRIGLSPPAVVASATREYLEAEDELGAWIEERIEIDAERASAGEWFVATAELTDDANTWRAEQGLPFGRGFEARDIAAALEMRGARRSDGPVRMPNGARVRGWYGIHMATAPLRVTAGTIR